MMKEKDTNNIQDNDQQIAAPTPDASTEKPSESDNMDHNDEGLSLKEVIQEQAIEGEAPQSRYLSLRKILGGDILNTAAIRRQIWLFILIVFFLILYIANRYRCQQNIIEIDHLQKELQDAKYKALSSTSQLTEKSRQSNVLKLLKNNEDSVLKMANQPPYIISIPE
jgi:hypothetical protein